MNRKLKNKINQEKLGIVISEDKEKEQNDDRSRSGIPYNSENVNKEKNKIEGNKVINDFIQNQMKIKIGSPKNKNKKKKKNNN